VLTKSRWRTCESSEAQKDLEGQPVKDDGDTCRVAEKRMEYATRGGFRGFGPQNPSRGPDADGRHVAASVRSLRSEATGEEAQWPSDHENSSWTIVPLAT